jgi:DnaJ like chaperone protein
MGVFGLLLQFGFTISSNKYAQRKIGFFGTNEEFLNTILYLAAHVAKADGKVEDSELFTIEKKLLQDYDPATVKRYMSYVNGAIDKDLSIKRICRVIVREFDIPSSIQLMNFLISIVVIDGWMSKKEMEALRQIAIAIRLPIRSFMAILAMHNYRLEGEQKKYKRVKRTSGLSLSRAYRILEIAESASDKQVKKAYRKLAIIHHPDKVIHLGMEFQKAAKEKFQKVADAYEVVKKKRGFK